MTAFGCTCEELTVVETRRTKGGDGCLTEYTGRVIRLRPPELHNCAYVKARQEMIPQAWKNALARTKVPALRCTYFHEEMEKLVALAYKKGEL